MDKLQHLDWRRYRTAPLIFGNRTVYSVRARSLYTEREEEPEQPKGVSRSGFMTCCREIQTMTDM